MRRRLNRKGKACLATLFFLLFVIFLYGVYLPDVKLTAQAEGTRLAEKTIVSAVNDAAEQSNVDLNSLISVQKDESGQIIGIATDSAALNNWKETLVENVEAALENETYEKLIPIGTLLDSVVLYGRGPKVPIKVTLGGFIHADIETDFDSAGINQTRYGVYLKVRFHVNTYLPFCNTVVETENRILLSEYVTVGDVPSLYTVPGIAD